MAISLIPRVYVSGKVGKETDADRLIDAFKDDPSFELTLDWRNLDVRKPYLVPHHRSLNHEAASMMRAAIARAELFVLVWDDDLLGALIELGMAMADPRPAQVHIIDANRTSIFFNLDVALHDTIDDFLETIP